MALPLLGFRNFHTTRDRLALLRGGAVPKNLRSSQRIYSSRDPANETTRHVCSGSPATGCQSAGTCPRAKPGDRLPVHGDNLALRHPRETTHSGSPERAHNGPPPGNDCNKSFGGCSYKSLAGDFTTRMSPESWPPSSWTTPDIWDTCTPFKPCGHCYLQPSEAAFSNGTTNMQHGNRDTTRPCSRSRRHRRRQRLQKPQRLQDQRPQCRRTWKFRYLRRKTKHDIRRRRRPRAHRTGRHRELRHYRRYVQYLLRSVVAYGWSESVFYIRGCSGPQVRRQGPPKHM